MTMYVLRVRYTHTGLERTYEFDSMTMRALCLISISPYVTVLEESEKVA